MGIFLFKHKNEIIAQFSLDENDANAKPKEIVFNEANKELIPMGAQLNNQRFVEWWRDRTIPKTRQGVKPALQKLGYESVTNAMIDNLALSLNDCYWICPFNKDVKWEDVNLFTNNFVDSLGELTFNQDAIIDIRDKTKFLKAISSQGEVQKKWCIDENNQRYLIKGNYGKSYQQSINEVLASNLHQLQGWKQYTPYYFIKIQLDNNLEGLGCYSYNFCNENVESISAWEVLQSKKIKMSGSLFYPFRELCLDLGIKDEEFQKFIDYQILSDFLLTNTDRHMNNISILRDSNSLQIIGFAPIYDTGNSMFYNISTQDFSKIRLGEEKISSFITSKEVNLLKYVKDRNILDITKCNVDFSIFDKEVEENKGRKALLQEIFEKKLDMIYAFQLGKDIWNKQIYINKKEELPDSIGGFASKLAKAKNLSNEELRDLKDIKIKENYQKEETKKEDASAQIKKIEDFSKECNDIKEDLGT